MGIRGRLKNRVVVALFRCEGHKMLFAARPAGLPLGLAVVVLSLVSAESLAAKCSPQMAWPGLEVGAPVMLVDGSLRMANELEEIDPSNIHSIQLTCWNPTTGEFGARTGVNVFNILTNGFVESTRAPIEELLRAQKAYFSKFSRYARSLDDLGGFGVPRDAMLEFSVTSDGWSATTRGDDVAYRCFVFSGDAPEELAEMKEDAVMCQFDEARAGRLMRETYEGTAGTG